MILSSITGMESGEVFLDWQFGSDHMTLSVYDYLYAMMPLTDKITYESALLTKADWPSYWSLTDDWTAYWWLTNQVANQLLVT